jgi:hypothetical protein
MLNSNQGPLSGGRNKILFCKSGSVTNCAGIILIECAIKHGNPTRNERDKHELVAESKICPNQEIFCRAFGSDFSCNNRGILGYITVNELREAASSTQKPATPPDRPCRLDPSRCFWLGTCNVRTLPDSHPRKCATAHALENFADAPCGAWRSRLRLPR